MADFKLVSDFNPSGDQPRAINELADGINSNIKFGAYQSNFNKNIARYTTESEAISKADRKKLTVSIKSVFGKLVLFFHKILDRTLFEFQ